MGTGATHLDEFVGDNTVRQIVRMHAVVAENAAEEVLGQRPAVVNRGHGDNFRKIRVDIDNRHADACRFTVDNGIKCDDARLDCGDLGAVENEIRVPHQTAIAEKLHDDGSQRGRVMAVGQGDREIGDRLGPGAVDDETDIGNIGDIGEHDSGSVIDPERIQAIGKLDEALLEFHDRRHLRSIQIVERNHR